MWVLQVMVPLRFTLTQEFTGGFKLMSCHIFMVVSGRIDDIEMRAKMGRNSGGHSEKEG